MDLQTAARRLGVHYQTAYRWVRDGSLKAVKVGSSYEVSDEEVARYHAERLRPRQPPSTTRVRDWSAQVDRMFRAVTDGDELTARAVVDRLAEGGVDCLVLCDKLFTPVMRQVGDAWATGRISVAEEHRASEIAERLLARCAAHPRGRPRGVAVVATAPGEEHGFPAAMAAVALRGDRWQVHHLGTEVPLDDLA